MEYITLSNGVKAPVIGIGTFMISPEDTENSVYSALKTGYRMIDTANAYMNALEEEFGELKRIKMDEDKVWEYLKLLFPIDGSETAKKEDWMKNARLGVYNAWNAPDLADREKSAFRFVNAVSDFATHSEPMRKTKNYQENLMWKTANGNPLIDKAYELVGALR